MREVEACERGEAGDACDGFRRQLVAPSMLERLQAACKLAVVDEVVDAVVVNAGAPLERERMQRLAHFCNRRGALRLEKSAARE